MWGFGWAKKFWTWLNSEALEDQVDAVMDLVVEKCHFLPTAASVAAMLTASNPAFVGVVAVATAICNALASKRVGLLRYAPTVNGVEIDGTWEK